MLAPVDGYSTVSSPFLQSEDVLETEYFFQYLAVLTSLQIKSNNVLVGTDYPLALDSTNMTFERMICLNYRLTWIHLYCCWMQKMCCYLALTLALTLDFTSVFMTYKSSSVAARCLTDKFGVNHFFHDFTTIEGRWRRKLISC